MTWEGRGRFYVQLLARYLTAQEGQEASETKRLNCCSLLFSLSSLLLCTLYSPQIKYAQDSPSVINQAQTADVRLICCLLCRSRCRKTVVEFEFRLFSVNSYSALQLKFCAERFITKRHMNNKYT